MFDDTVLEFLDRPAFLRLATLMADGSPQITVLWYRRDGENLRIVCPESAQKVRNLDRDGRVSAVIEDPESAQRYIELRGTAEVIRDDAEARDELCQIAARYIGDQAPAYVDQLSADPRVILDIHVGRMFRRNV